MITEMLMYTVFGGREFLHEGKTACHWAECVWTNWWNIGINLPNALLFGAFSDGIFKNWKKYNPFQDKRDQ